VLQGVERVGASVIAHSLGEFVFDGTVGHVVARRAAERRRESLVLCLEIGGENTTVERVPTRTGIACRPELPDAPTAAVMRERLKLLDALLEAPDYPAAFRSNAAKNLAGHELRVLLSAIRRFDIVYLVGKLGRIRPRHLAVLAAFVRDRFGGGSR
jgi:hypothetical protein